MTVLADVQKLEPGKLIELLEADLTPFGGEVLRFHGYAAGGVIIWNGEEYTGWPLEASGFERTGAQPPRPRLLLGNVNGAITSLCLLYEDLVGAIVTRRRTFHKYLDAANFDGGNPDADPDEEFPPEIWIVDRKSNETPEGVEFELASAMEFNDAQLPGRQIITNFCPWIAIGGYRGPFCGYTGDPVAMRDDTPTSDPALDRCGGRVVSCKLRFGEAGALPYGGFAAAGLIRG